MGQRRLDDFEGALEESLSEAAAWCFACGVSVLWERVSTQAVSLGWPGAIRGDLRLATFLALIIALLVNNDEISRNSITCRHCGQTIGFSMGVAT